MIFKTKIKKQKTKSIFVPAFLPVLAGKLCLLFTFYFLLSGAVFAQQASPSGSLIQKLDELKKEIASKAAQIKGEIDKKVQNKAVIGTILNLDDSEMVIQTIGSSKTVKVDEFTEILGTKGKKIGVGTLEESDKVAALGDFDDKNNLVAKRIIYLENFATTSGELVWGRVQKSRGSMINILDKPGNAETITTSSQTAFYLGNNEASLEDVKPEKFMVARGTRLKDGSLRARFVYFIPSVGFVKPSQKSASPSATSVETNE